MDLRDFRLEILAIHLPYVFLKCFVVVFCVPREAVTFCRSFTTGCHRMRAVAQRLQDYFGR